AIIIVAIFLATAMLCLESFMIMRSGWHLNGLQLLKRAGVELPGRRKAGAKAGAFLIIRIGLAAAMAQLTAIFVALLIFAADTTARLEHDYLQANAPLVASATELVRAAIGRATKAVEAQAAHVDEMATQLAALRKNEIDPFSSDPRVEDIQR